MRRAAVLAALLLVGCGAHEYTPPEGDFRISLPDAPVAETDAQGALYKVMDGKAERRISYVIRRVAIPETDAGVGDERLFDGFQSAGVRGLNGRRTGSRPVTSGGVARVGREFTVEAETPTTGEPYRMIWRIFRVGSYLYVVQATTARDADRQATALAVLDTFALLK